MHSKQIGDATQRTADAQGRLSEKECENDVLKKDKKLLLEELDLAKKRELKLVTSWESKYSALQESSQHKMSAFEASKEKEYADRMHRLEERLRVSEETLDQERSRFTAKKNSLEEKISDLEAKHRRDEVSQKTAYYMIPGYTKKRA